MSIIKKLFLLFWSPLIASEKFKIKQYDKLTERLGEAKTEEEKKAAIVEFSVLNSHDFL